MDCLQVRPLRGLILTRTLASAILLLDSEYRAVRTFSLDTFLAQCSMLDVKEKDHA
jgi:hypothetical protein